MMWSAAEPKSCELRSTERIDQRPGTVVAARAALGVNANRAPRQLHFVPHGEYVLRTKLVLFEQLAYRNAAQVHVRLRLGENHFFSRQFSQTYQGLCFWP